MPTISVNRDLLFKALGRSYTEDEFNSLCFDFGIELDDVTTDRQSKMKELGTDKIIDASDDVIYKIEVSANRYDILCIEGLARALLIFQGKIKIPQYKTVKPSIGPHQQLIVLQNTKQVRPFAVAAILRNITFNQQTYDSFIDLQDKLHQNLCRKRTLVAIGTHDLDTIEGPFIYDAKPPNQIKFKPLKPSDKEYTATELMDIYSNDQNLKAYVPIIRDSAVYPIIYDKNKVVLSMPPIINGDHSKITLKTKNVFIECTATDKTKAKLVLDTLVCMFSEYCREQYTTEQVEVIYKYDDKPESSSLLPELPYRNQSITVDYINNNVGIKKSAEEIANLLTRMGLNAKPLDDKNINVTIPPSRQDILHACDIMEDVGIAFGYNNIPMTFPKVITIGKQFLLNKISDELRNEVARCGYTEALTFSLCSRDDNNFKIDGDLSNAVHISNPKTSDFQVARTSLIPGLLKTIHSNKNIPLPLKLFEISDVVLKDNNKDVGARNERRLAAVHYNKSPGFEIIHGLLDRVMQVMEVSYSPNKDKSGYYIKAFNDSRFLSGRCASVIVNGKECGIMGVLHPQVILNFDLNQPCAVLEINLHHLFTLK